MHCVTPSTIDQSRAEGGGMSIEIRGLNIAIGTKPIVRDVCMA